MGKYFNPNQQEKGRKDIAKKIKGGQHIPWNILASRINNEMMNPEANKASDTYPDYVNDWIKMNK